MPAFMRTRGFLLLALVLSAALTAGAAFALVNAGDDSPGLTATAPTATPTTEPTTEPPSTAAPFPTFTATSAPVPTTTAPTAAPTATETAAPTSRPTSGPTSAPARTYPYPRPTQRYDELSMDLTYPDQPLAPNSDVGISATGTDGDGDVYFNGLTWGDGTGVAAQPAPHHCPSYPPLTSPHRYQPEPSKRTYVFHHRYAVPGKYTLVVHVASNNGDCKPHGPAAEYQSLEGTITIVAPTAS